MNNTESYLALILSTPPKYMETSKCSVIRLAHLVFIHIHVPLFFLFFLQCKHNILSNSPFVRELTFRIWGKKENPSPNQKIIFLTWIFQFKISIQIFYISIKRIYITFLFNFIIVVSQGPRINLDPWHQDGEYGAYCILTIMNRSKLYVQWAFFPLLLTMK